MIRQKRKGRVSKCKSTTLCHTSGSVPRKDAIMKQTVFTWVIFGLYRTCMHIRLIIPHSMYRAGCFWCNTRGYQIFDIPWCIPHIPRMRQHQHSLIILLLATLTNMPSDTALSSFVTEARASADFLPSVPMPTISQSMAMYFCFLEGGFAWLVFGLFLVVWLVGWGGHWCVRTIFLPSFWCLLLLLVVLVIVDPRWWIYLIFGLAWGTCPLLCIFLEFVGLLGVWVKFSEMVIVTGCSVSDLDVCVLMHDCN